VESMKAKDLRRAHLDASPAPCQDTADVTKYAIKGASFEITDRRAAIMGFMFVSRLPRCAPSGALVLDWHCAYGLLPAADMRPMQRLVLQASSTLLFFLFAGSRSRYTDLPLLGI
jgi:hypothetical protein